MVRGEWIDSGGGGRGLQITSRPALIAEYLIALTWASLAPGKGRAAHAYLVCNHSLNHFFVAPKQWDLGAKANNFCAGRVSSPSLIFPPSGTGTHGVICAEIGSWLTPTMSYPLGGPREGETRDTWGELCFPVADLWSPSGHRCEVNPYNSGSVTGGIKWY